MKKIIYIAFFLLLQTSLSIGQKKEIITSRNYPQGYFRNPLNIAMDASGTFGELRSTHFHAGDDYRTQQRIGLPLHAAAEGYVSRVRVQIGGGGNSVYIDHPNGYTTVYLHMEDFNDVLTNIIRAEQYKQKRFDVDLTLNRNQVVISRGMLIGHAGNSGGSGGPHLHFEIRDTKSQHPLNPQLFGLKFTDSFRPTINGIMLYDLNAPLFNERTPRKPISVKSVGTGSYALTQTSPIPVSGRFGFGINTVDRHRNGGFQNGVYSIELLIDEKPVSTVVFEELDFNTSRGIHSYIDYAHWKKTKVKIQKSFKDPGNAIEIFKTLPKTRGIELQEQKVYNVKYIVKDVAGNTSELNFQIENKQNVKSTDYQSRGVQLFKFDKVNSFERTDVKVNILQKVLYDDLDFEYSSLSAPANSYSLLHKIHNNLTPVFQAYNISIKPTSLPTHLHKKALIASIENGAEGGSFENGWVSVNTRNFGSFYIVVDTVSPTIVPRNLTSGKNVSPQRKIDFTISDNLSGIQSFDGYIDGQWVLMEYDSKNKHLWHTFDSSLAKGSHTFKLIVKDWKDNEKVYEASFIK